VYQAGTMAGNPVALASGLATLTELKTGAPYQALAQLSEALGAKLSKHKAREVVQLKQVGSLFWPYLAQGPVPTTMAAVSPVATARYTQAYRQWLAHGVYLPPSAWEVSFLSTVHTPAHLDTLLDALALPVTAPHA
jgi:glutamate-1-semialdehyde 2,1-aminomutase